MATARIPDHEPDPALIERLVDAMRMAAAANPPASPLTDLEAMAIAAIRELLG